MSWITSIQPGSGARSALLLLQQHEATVSPPKVSAACLWAWICLTPEQTPGQPEEPKQGPGLPINCWLADRSIQFYLYNANSQHMSSQGSSQQSGSYIPVNRNH
ncbi:hypothetical protein ILYODFUR_037953 [Ilyodon furcidens]|uniref:Uncharacterized protein n=1 Tax=Ilyodon furcidens TaxID=33524 RepID=A0ABV0U1I0_9TELE